MSPFEIDLLLRIYSHAEPLADYSPMQMPLVDETLGQFASRGWIAMVDGNKPKLRAEGNFIILRLKEIGDEPLPKLQVLEPKQEKTLLDEFAGQAMQGMLADPTVRNVEGNADKIASKAYVVAKAMIAAREAA